MSRMRVLIFLSLACMIGLVLPANAMAVKAASVQVVVNGQLSEAGTLLPIAGGSVGVYQQNNKGVYVLVDSLTSAADGRWSYSGRRGSYRFDVSAAGADPLSVSRTYAVNGIFDMPISLDCYGWLSGVVKSAATGLPIAGAQVDFYPAAPDGGWAASPAASVVAPDGAYMSPRLATGVYAVKASAPGFTSAYYGGATPASVTVARGSTGADLGISLAVPVPQTGSISGRMTIASTGAGEHGMVFLYKQNADGTWPVYTGFGGYFAQVESDYDGYYTFSGVPLGTYRVRLNAVHFATQWWHFKATYDAADSVVLDTPGQVVTDIDAVYPMPTP